MAPQDIASSIEIEGGLCCAGSVSMTPFYSCVETAVPVRNSGNGMWGLQKYHNSEMQGSFGLM